MEIFQTFGINIYLLVAEIINFLVVLYVLKRFLYGPIFKMLKKREDTIQKGLEDADKSKQLLEKAKQEEADIIKKANERSEQIIANAKNESFDIVQTAHEQAKKQAQLILDNAKEQVEQDRKKAERQIFEKITSVMRDFLEKSTDDLFNEKMQDMLVDNALTKFKKVYKS